MLIAGTLYVEDVLLRKVSFMDESKTIDIHFIPSLNIMVSFYINCINVLFTASMTKFCYVKPTMMMGQKKSEFQGLSFIFIPIFRPHNSLLPK
uniref:Uncharacterized protein n=1 Tax=Helianthus annuus TaxID=4232 RepID=A0A251TLC0_HELAN